MSTSIVFVDSRVANYQSLIDGLTQPIEVFILTPESDGVEQIRARLQGRTDIDALHIISHGSEGALYLGSTVLNQENISSYSSSLAGIGGSLTETGDILLYGCNVAQGDAGQAFISQLAELTGADVAASDDATGATEFGGDWVLEKSVDTVETPTIQANAYASTLGTTQTQTQNFSATHQSLWSDSAGTSIHYTFETFVAHLDDTHYGSSVTANVLGSSLGLDYALDMTGTSFGIPIEMGISSGVFDLNYPVLSSIALPSSVLAGDTFSIATGFSGVNAPTMTIDGPNLELSIKAMFNTNLSGHFGLEYSGIPLVDDGAFSLFGETSNNGQSYTDTVIPIVLEKEIISLPKDAPEGGIVLNNNFTFSEETLGGSKVFRNPFISLGYDLSMGQLDGTADAKVDASGLVDMSAIISPESPWFSLTFDIDDITGKLLELVPATAAAGTLVRRLDQEFRSKLEILGVDLSTKYDAALLSMSATLGIKPAMKVEFDAQDILVTMTANTGEYHTGHLGDTFSFSSPSDATPLTVTSSYSLEGEIKTSVGLVVTGGIDVKLIGAEGKVFGLNIPAFFPDGSDEGTEAENYLFEYSLEKNLYEFFPDVLSMSHDVTYALGSPTSYNIAYGTSTATPTLNLPNMPTYLTVSVVGASSNNVDGY